MDELRKQVSINEPGTLREALTKTHTYQDPGSESGLFVVPGGSQWIEIEGYKFYKNGSAKFVKMNLNCPQDCKTETESELTLLYESPRFLKMVFVWQCLNCCKVYAARNIEINQTMEEIIKDRLQ